MTAKQLKTATGFDFTKKNKVSVWVSVHPYQDIPDEYFEESFSKNNTRATNTWSKNYQMRFFAPENMETNGSADGLVDIQQASGECSFSLSFIDNLMSKAKKKHLLKISWIILLFEYEYSSKLAGVEQDEFTTFLGAFNYDDDAESLIVLEQEQDNDSDHED